MNGDFRQLIEAAGRGDLSAATELVDRFYGPIYAFLRRLAGSEADAADLTQKTFTRVWSALPRFAGRASLSSWLHGIAWHVCQDWRRANHRLESRPDAWWEDCPDRRPTPDQQVAETDLAATVYATVDRLEVGLRDTVHLHYYQGLTLDETANALGVATSTVKHRLRTAIHQLQSHFAHPPHSARNLNSLSQS